MYMKEFHNLVPEIDRRAQEFIDNPQIFPELLENARAETAYVKYGLYQYITSKGPMNPDAFYEMDVQSTVRRGRLVNKQPDRPVYHRYAFNKSGQLLYFEWIYDYTPYRVEVVLREEPFVWGFNMNMCGSQCESAWVRVCGNYIEDNRIVADFWTDSVMRRRGELRCTLMHYENGVPVRYCRNAHCFYERDKDGFPINITNPFPFIYKLYLNEKGDVVKVCMLRDEFDEGKPERTHVLIRPVPRSRWDNLYGLI